MTTKQGRSVLVTGANRGIGLEIARKFQAEGDQVVGAYRKNAPSETFLAAACDVTDPQDVDRVFTEAEQAHGPVEVLVAKAGLIGLARSLAREVGPRCITVNVVAPGLTETDMSGALTDEQREHLPKQIPTGRLAQPQEIAEAVYFVAGQGYINGEILHVDGGAAMGH